MVGHFIFALVVSLGLAVGVAEILRRLGFFRWITQLRIARWLCSFACLAYTYFFVQYGGLLFLAVACFFGGFAITAHWLYLSGRR